MTVMKETNFYNLDKQYKEHLRVLSEASNKKTIKSYYDIMSDFISKFDVSLKHVDEEQIHVYFDFSDLLENILLACKNHNFKLSQFITIIIALKDIYEKDISIMLMPANIANINLEMTKEKIAQIADMAKTWNIYPTLADYDEIIRKELDLLDDQERTRLKNILRNALQ